MNKKIISLFEISIILIGVISFVYLISFDRNNDLSVDSFVFGKNSDSLFLKIIKFVFDSPIKAVSANSFVPSGCCLETIGGSVCQDMVFGDSANCKDNLIGTGCNVVEECQVGCCYVASGGICTLNSPKQKCEEGGGKWSNDDYCDIEECQVGCCILGDGATMTTNRECTILSNQYSFDRDFKPLDVAGSCDSYLDLSDEGACLTDSTDYSDKKNCVFTTKGKCSGEFKKGYLCTSVELNTSCEKTDKTSCFDGKDEIYFVDSCKNRANIYDYSKINNQSYWEKYISPSESCAGQGAECGNCDYKTGSVCTKYVSGKDLVKPKSGDYVCKNLNCANGRKHGESWCVSDYDLSGVASASVGSGSYVAKCIEGEISIEGCAEFNQQICLESTDTSFGFSEAMCVVNDWRACLNANEKESYIQVKSICDQNPQCIMFLDIPGNEKYKELPGFKTDVSNSEQGNAGKIGEDANKILVHCVPKYTPGLQFWTANANPFSTSSGAVASSANYGGDVVETNSLCSMGSFTCVSHQEIDKSILLGTTGKKDKENPECNIDAFDQSKQKVSLLMEALNERCRSIGSCGTQANVQGQVSGSFTITRVHINEKGKSKTNYSVSGYNLTDEYWSSMVGKQSSVSMGSLKTLSQIASLRGGGAIILMFYSLLTGRVTQEMSRAAEEAGAANSANAADQQAGNDLTMQTAGSVGALAAMGRSTVGSTTVALDASRTYFQTVGENNLGLSVYKTVNPQIIPPGSTFTAGAKGATVSVGGVKNVLQPGQTLVAPIGKDAATATVTTGSGNAVKQTSALSQGLKNAGTQLAVTALAMVAAYFLGKLILKNSGMSPAEGANFMGAMMAGASLAVTVGYAAYGSSTIAGTATAGYFGGATAATAGSSGGVVAGSFLAVFGAIMFWVAVAYFIYSLFSESTDHVYYIINYQCEAWTPPAVGDCNVCNDDVRPCSEYKCKSLGNNCHYFVENGEPGYCASISEVWSAKISPWQDVLTEGNKYANVKDFGFEIEGANKKEVAAWMPLTFGITTDKQAICKIGLNHSASFDQMGYTMLSDKNYETGKVDGMHHKIVLSPHVQLAGVEEQTGTTLPLLEGENEYYIKCRNFAGQENEAPFIVQVEQSEGYDLSEPIITRFVPEDNSYVAVGVNSTRVSFYLNEPAECKYSIEYDYVYDEMQNNFSCLTGSTFAHYGEWPCYAMIENLTKKTELFIKCKDQPELVETDLVTRMVNQVSIPYTINICETGLEISSVRPASGVIEIIDSTDVNLEVQTRGCINGGDAHCSFSVGGHGNNFVDFLKTGGKVHTQSFTSFGLGSYNVSISCEDSAGNKANTTTNFTLFKDDFAPVVNRVYSDGGKLILKTNEDSFCWFNQNNATLGCDFDFGEGSESYSNTHTLTLSNEDALYYIKCKDKRGNEPLGCSVVIRA